MALRICHRMWNKLHCCYYVIVFVIVTYTVLLLHNSTMDGHHNHDRWHVNHTKPSEVRMLTYNFYIRPPFVAELTGDYKDQRLRMFTDTVLNDYDILAFQELFGSYSSRRKRFIHAAAERGLKYSAEGPMGSIWKGKLVDSGLLILSRYPIVEMNNVMYDAGSTVDKLAAKGATYARIQLSSTRHLHLFNTHLQASYSTTPSISDHSVVTRIAQLTQCIDFMKTSLSTHIDSIRSGRDVVIFAGDLNINGQQEDQEEYKRLFHMLGRIRIDAPSRMTNESGKPTPLEVGFVPEDLLTSQTGGCQPVTQVPWSWLSYPKYRNFTKNVEAEFGSRLDYIIKLKPVVHSEDGQTKLKTTEVKMDRGVHCGTDGLTGASVEDSTGVVVTNGVSDLGMARTRVENFEVEGKKFIQLSDHRGVSSVIHVPEPL
ncbi:Endonuclease/exonuclease/phosphatase [Paraphysoderma sedebokerense]|nr:Endonuclease/exonuclease/phosphatase [Paraphysoderma sedebokerense]